MITFYYPDSKNKRAPRDITCSECGKTIHRGGVYRGMNHGRYCIPCSHNFVK